VRGVQGLYDSDREIKTPVEFLDDLIYRLSDGRILMELPGRFTLANYAFVDSTSDNATQITFLGLTERIRVRNGEANMQWPTVTECLLAAASMVFPLHPWQPYRRLDALDRIIMIHGYKGLLRILRRARDLALTRVRC
jgi:hypothetical protein